MTCERWNLPTSQYGRLLNLPKDRLLTNLSRILRFPYPVKTNSPCSAGASTLDSRDVNCYRLVRMKTWIKIDSTRTTTRRLFFDKFFVRDKVNLLHHYIDWYQLCGSPCPLLLCLRRFAERVTPIPLIHLPRQQGGIDCSTQI